MLTWIGLALVTGAAAVTARWVLTRVDALGRPVAFPWIAVVPLLGIGLVAFVPGIQRGREERRLASAASRLVGTAVTVHCQTGGEAFVDLGGELGYVRFRADGVPERHTLIKRDQCGHLRRYLRSHGRDPSPDQVIAVHVLTHESMHMAGLTSESVTECAAMQRDARMAVLLGASPADAAALARRYWREVYPRMPDDYRTSQCGPGAPLDERLPDAPWPTA